MAKFNKYDVVNAEDWHGEYTGLIVAVTSDSIYLAIAEEDIDSNKLIAFHTLDEWTKLFRPSPLTIRKTLHHFGLMTKVRVRAYSRHEVRLLQGFYTIEELLTQLNKQTK